MQKHHSPSSAKQIQTGNEDSYTFSSFDINKSCQNPTKLSRKDVSKCISIWADLYHLRDTHLETGGRDLYLPSRPWLGRSLNSLKRFE